MINNLRNIFLIDFASLWLNIIEEVNKEIVKEIPDIKRIGLLATEATSRGPLYRESLNKMGIEVIAPEAESKEEKLVRKIIEDVKLNRVDEITKKELLSLCGWLRNKGTEAVILGCTEISAVMSPDKFDLPVFDTTRIYAKATVKKAMDAEKRKVNI